MNKILELYNKGQLIGKILKCKKTGKYGLVERIAEEGSWLRMSLLHHLNENSEKYSDEDMQIYRAYKGEYIYLRELGVKNDGYIITLDFPEFELIESKAAEMLFGRV